MPGIPETLGYARRLADVLGLNKRAIARLCDCSPQTLYDWLKRRPEVMARVD